ncbi:hypothetical protein Godav_028275, partial [Gossypium davidsonii]|nr:hypothetical protein [Gossypium davidsonii]
MQNEEGQNMDLYIPRKCSATNRLITSKDHASVQINVGHLDELGRYTGTFSTFALCGFVRAQTIYHPGGAEAEGALSPHTIGPPIDGSKYVWLFAYWNKGDADSALDRLWQKKKAEVRQ